MAVILEFDLACRPQSDGSLAGMVIVKELVGRSEVAGLVLPVVEVSLIVISVSSVCFVFPFGMYIYHSKAHYYQVIFEKYMYQR